MKTDFLCPLCTVPMTAHQGTQLNPKDGVTMVCLSATCTAHENVAGHGKNEKDAYETACQKYKKNDKKEV
jgi:hypothetical protein